MKKILSLVLAVAMLSTTAFAADAYIGTGASGITGGNKFTPGKTLNIDAADFANDDTAPISLDGIGWRLCTEYFTISAKKFDKGANLVKEVKINDDKNTVQIVLNDNYDLVMPNGENLVIKDLSIKARKEYNEKNNDTPSGKVFAAGEFKKDTYTYIGNADIYVGYDKSGANYEQKLDNSPEYRNGELVKFIVGSDDTVVYETASLTEGDVYIEGRVYKDDKVYLEIDYDVNKEVLKLDDTAAMRFINITTNGLPTANTLQITAEEDEFVYKIVDGKIVASGLKWSADDYAWVGKVRTNASYVISDIELKASSAAAGDAPSTTNPDTGANDVVGIAAALAVVSLVAAGAVSLKK